MTLHCEIHKLHEVLDRIKDSIKAHCDEIAHGAEGAAPDVDVEYYLAASAQNKCFVVTLHKDGAVIGHAIFTVDRDPHNKSALEANNNLVFVQKPHRGHATMVFLEKAATFLKQLGVKKINYLVKNEALSRLLERIGYAPEYKLWSHSL